MGPIARRAWKRTNFQTATLAPADAGHRTAIVQGRWYRVAARSGPMRWTSALTTWCRAVGRRRRIKTVITDQKVMPASATPL